MGLSVDKVVCLFKIFIEDNHDDDKQSPRGGDDTMLDEVEIHTERDVVTSVAAVGGHVGSNMAYARSIAAVQRADRETVDIATLKEW